MLYERFVCRRPLHRVAAWLADMGLPISPGTLADSIKRFVPLFEPLAEAILAHQNTASLRHTDDTTWRVQAYREKGRSNRAWLWTSVSRDALYYHIDPSRSAEVAIRCFVGYGLHECLPDHSSLTRIRQRWGEERFQAIFQRTVKACLGAKVATAEVVHIDASLIRADVSWETQGCSCGLVQMGQYDAGQHQERDHRDLPQARPRSCRALPRQLRLALQPALPPQDHDPPLRP